MADKVTLAELMEEQRTLGGRPALPNVMPREMRQPVLGQSNLVDTALSSFGRPSLEALRMGYEGKATPQEIARTFLETGPVGPFGAVRNPVANPIRAYHGSPHDFDEFRLDRIGTGEGVQNFGPGLSFAENPRVAESYRVPGDRRHPALDLADEATAEAAGDPRMAREFLARVRATVPEEAHNVYLARQILERPDHPLPPELGRMYEINLHARPEQFLDWDRPLGTQSPEVLEALRRAGYEAATRRFWRTREPTGGTVVNAWGSTVADDLGRAGIPGIRYLDDVSRDVGHGGHNYTVFTPEIIEILRKYGIIAPPVGMGAAAAMSGDAQQ